MEKIKASIKMNFIMNALLTMSAFIFPLVTFPYVSRILLPAGTGKVAFASSVLSYFSMFSQLGIPTYGIRACAKVRDNKEELSRMVHELFFINLITSIVAYIVFFVALLSIQRLQANKSLYVIFSTGIILNTIGMEWLYKALEQYTYITIRSVIFKLLGLILMLSLIHTESDYIVYGAITVFSASGSYILNFINIRRHIYITPTGHYNFKRHFKAIAVFFAMACATTVYTYLDTVMLGFMTTDADVGFYYAAVKIKSILISVVTSLSAVLLPRASYYVENGLMDEFKNIAKKALNFVFMVSTPMMIYFVLFAKQGIYFLSGSMYEGAIIPMKIIMPTLLLIGITNILGIQILVPLGREKIVLYSEIIGAIVNLITNGLLIPRYASAGAAIGTLLAESVVLLVQYTALRGEIANTFKNIHYVHIIIASLLGTCVAVWIPMLNLSCFLTLLISAILYFGVYCEVLLIMKEPLALEIVGQVVKIVGKKVKNR